MNPDQKIAQLGLVLPPAPKPVGAYVPSVAAGKLVFLSGQLSKDAAGQLHTGKIGGDLTLEEGQEAARWAALNLLSVIQSQIGFDKVARIVKMTGFVQVVPDFARIPEVLNPASELFAAVFGERGTHARAAVGVASLPLNAAVEIELVLETP